MSYSNSFSGLSISGLQEAVIFRKLNISIGWTGSENCAAIVVGTHEVRFNRDAYWTDLTGWSFVNTTTPETATGVLAVTETSPSRKLTFNNITWVTEPAAGDIIEARYDGLGNFINADGLAMLAQTITLVNCQDPTIGITNLAVSATSVNLIIISFDEPVNTSLLTYDVYVNNLLTATLPVGTSTYTADGLIANTDYNIKVDTVFNNVKSIGSDNLVSTTQTGIVIQVDNAGQLSEVFMVADETTQTLTAPFNTSIPEINTARFS